VKTIGAVQRTGVIGQTVLPKEARIFDKQTGTVDTVPYVEKKNIQGTSTIVRLF
jgi:hypothetical protein